MASFVITAVFKVTSDGIRADVDVAAVNVAADWWGPGHQLSHCDGRILTLVVEVTAPDAGHALDAVLSRAEAIWMEIAAEALPPPSTVRVEEVLTPQNLGAGGPDRLLAEAVAGRAARLRAAVAALSDIAPSDITLADLSPADRTSTASARRPAWVVGEIRSRQTNSTRSATVFTTSEGR